MWLKRPDKNTVENLLTGLTFIVRAVKDSREAVMYWEVVSASTVRVPPNVTLASGYLTEEEALAALDDFLSAQEIPAIAFQPPMIKEETEEEEVSE